MTNKTDSPIESVVNVDSIVICEIANRKAKNDIKKCICISTFYITYRKCIKALF